MRERRSNMITITMGEGESLLELLELHLIPIIREDTDIDSMEWLSNMISIYQKCKVAVEQPEAEEERQIAVPAEKNWTSTTRSVADADKPKESEPQRQTVFVGFRADYKRAVYTKLLELRTQGVSIPELVKMSEGKVTDEEIVQMLAAGKVHISKWEIVGDAVGIKPEEI